MEILHASRILYVIYVIIALYQYLFVLLLYPASSRYQLSVSRFEIRVKHSRIEGRIVANIILCKAGKEVWYLVYFLI